MDLKPDSEKFLELGVDHVIFTAAVTTKAMQAKDRLLILNTAAAVAGAVTLPKVAEAAGKIVVIRDDGNYGANVTIDDAGDDSLFSQLTNNAANEYAVLYSDGTRWYTLVTSM